MELRMNHYEANPAAYKAMLGLEQFIQNSGLDRKLYEWIKLRASQINNCSYCIDMHAKDLLSMGESAEKLLLLTAWHEVPHFTAEERAVIELTEYATKLSEAGVPKEVYDRVRQHFSEKQFIDLIMAINVINAWNRIGVSTGLYPGAVK
ncbi:carboxymuconolactone decarboxylase family protein [Cohnella sp. LGH]|uniref:AhpD family alkylhydroperoxidase n=1 Tax=Cohnella phaseoli TaxID=456490 RepID=A0A3D9IMM9_9BACL|nr:MULTISPECIES: carboxymuconolactone decarboxylase family protein [Cohnella]QTH42615.1 carboxymuconolactone decarboxylase family protein [Cohnella sp. LGH]RED62975.1 AhpD family alkylhydroperoxidase [Cohnella phaseoli]